MRKGYPNLIPSILETFIWVLYKSENENWDLVGASPYAAPNIDEQRPHAIFQLAITQCASKIPSSSLAQMKDLKGLKQFQVQSWWDLVGARK